MIVSFITIILAGDGRGPAELYKTYQNYRFLSREFFAA